MDDLQWNQEKKNSTMGILGVGFGTYMGIVFTLVNSNPQKAIVAATLFNIPLSFFILMLTTPPIIVWSVSTTVLMWSIPKQWRVILICMNANLLIVYGLLMVEILQNLEFKIFGLKIPAFVMVWVLALLFIFSVFVVCKFSNWLLTKMTTIFNYLGHLFGQLGAFILDIF